jgi:hypothetical protein
MGSGCRLDLEEFPSILVNLLSRRGKQMTQEANSAQDDAFAIVFTGGHSACSHLRGDDRRIKRGSKVNADARLETLIVQSAVQLLSQQ